MLPPDLADDSWMTTWSRAWKEIFGMFSLNDVDRGLKESMSHYTIILILHMEKATGKGSKETNILMQVPSKNNGNEH